MIYVANSTYWDKAQLLLYGSCSSSFILNKLLESWEFILWDGKVKNLLAISKCPWWVSIHNSANLVGVFGKGTSNVIKFTLLLELSRYMINDSINKINWFTHEAGLLMLLFFHLCFLTLMLLLWWLFLWRGEGKKAAACLRTALREYNLKFGTILNDPDLASFRALPEFKELQEEVF